MGMCQKFSLCDSSSIYNAVEKKNRHHNQKELWKGVEGILKKAAKVDSALLLEKTAVAMNNFNSYHKTYEVKECNNPHTKSSSAFTNWVLK